MPQVSEISLFRTELKRLSQMSYLLGAGVALVVETDQRVISQSLRRRIESLCTDGKPVTAAALKATEVGACRVELPRFIADLLLVYLEAVLHLRLASRAGVPSSKQPPSIEVLVARLGVGGLPTDEWWFKDLVLLSEIRNKVVHSDGAVRVPCKRLIAAGWEQSHLDAQPCLVTRSYSDFLRFKRSARTAANKLLA